MKAFPLFRAVLPNGSARCAQSMRDWLRDSDNCSCVSVRFQAGRGYEIRYRKLGYEGPLETEKAFLRSALQEINWEGVPAQFEGEWLRGEEKEERALKRQRADLLMKREKFELEKARCDPIWAQDYEPEISPVEFDEARRDYDFHMRKALEALERDEAIFEQRFLDWLFDRNPTGTQPEPNRTESRAGGLRALPTHFQHTIAPVTAEI